MKQLLRSLYDRLTYRNEYTDPDPADGLWVSEHGFGERTVHDPAVPGYLHARRVRLVRDGGDDIDLMLLDDDTAALLMRTRHTLDRQAAAQRSRQRTPGAVGALVPRRAAA